MSRIFLYGMCALGWLVPFYQIEQRVAITFALFMLNEYWKTLQHRKLFSEPQSIPEKARSLSLLDAGPLQEDNT